MKKNKIIACLFTAIAMMSVSTQAFASVEVTSEKSGQQTTDTSKKRHYYHFLIQNESK